jgi:hypothetical protein
LSSDRLVELLVDDTRFTERVDAAPEVLDEELETVVADELEEESSSRTSTQTTTTTAATTTVAPTIEPIRQARDFGGSLVDDLSLG